MSDISEQMTQSLTLKGMKSLPNLEAMGFSGWKPLWDAIGKQQRIYRESHEQGAEWERLVAEVEELEQRAQGELKNSILSGEEITEAADALPEKRQQLEEAKKLGAAYHEAQREVYQEVATIAAEYASVWVEQVQGRAQEQMAEVEATMLHLQQLVAGLALLGGLKEWLEHPTRGFSYGKPSRIGGAVSTILEEARSTKALPKTGGDVALIGIQHPGNAVAGEVPEFFASALNRQYVIDDGKG